MAQVSIKAGATSQSIMAFIQDSSSTVGLGLGAVAPAGGALLTGTKAYYSFTGTNAASVQITLSVLATVGAAWSSGGIVTIDDTNMKGWVRLDIPDAVIAASKGRMVALNIYGGTNMAQCPIVLEITGWDNQDAVHGGMSAMPNAAAGASGGMPINGSNTGPITFTGGMVLSGTAAAGATPATAGLVVSGGAASTTGGGVAAAAATFAGGAGAASTNGAASGVTMTGGGTNTVASNAHGLLATGASTGDGVHGLSGAGATGDGFGGVSQATNGNGFGGYGHGNQDGFQGTGGATGRGLHCIGGATSGAGIYVETTSGDGVTIVPTAGNGIAVTANGTSKHGIVSTGGTAGTSDGVKCVAGTGGVDLRANITGNLSGSVTSVTNIVTANVTQINAVSTSNVTTVSANIGTTQPVNFTGTGATAYVKVDLTLIATASLSTSTAQIGVNVVNWGGTATAGAVPPDQVFIRTGTAQAGGASTITLDSGASATNNLYQNQIVQIYSGTGVGESAIIASYVGSSKVATIVGTWATNPDNTSKFLILPFGSITATVTGTPTVNVTQWLGQGVAATSAGIPNVNATAINNVATTSVTTVSANVGTTQPLNFTGTGGSALVKSDMVDIAGAAVNTTLAQIGVNIVNVAGSASTGAAGYVGIDWGQVTNKTTTNALTGTTISSSQVVASVTGAVGSVTAVVSANVTQWGGTNVLTAIPPDIVFIRSGTAQGGGASTITLDSGASATNNFYQDQIVLITSGAGAGQSAIIASYVGATKVATINGSWATNPDNSSVFLLLPMGAIPATVAGTVNANVTQWLSNPVSAVAAGIPDVNVKNINNVVAATPGAAGGILIAGTNAATTINSLTLAGVAAVTSTPATAGLIVTGGAASTTAGGVAAQAITATGGAGAASTNGAAEGVLFAGGGTNTVSSMAHGLHILGTSVGTGAKIIGGSIGLSINAGTNSAGIFVNGNGSGDAIDLIAGVTGDGCHISGGATSGTGLIVDSFSGDAVQFTATGGVDLRAPLIQGDLGGRVLGNTATAFAGVGVQVDKTGYSLSSAGLDSVVTETALNMRQAMSIICASAAGVLSGVGSGTDTFKGGGVATTRIVATVDGVGNRTGVTLFPPP